MFVDQLGRLWLSAPTAFVVLIGALTLVLWANSGLRLRPQVARVQAHRTHRRQPRATNTPRSAVSDHAIRSTCRSTLTDHATDFSRLSVTPPARRRLQPAAPSPTSDAASNIRYLCRDRRCRTSSLSTCRVAESGLKPVA